MNRASPQQWGATILNMTKQGIRKEEIACSGLLEWLDGQSGSVSKHGLLGHACFDDVKVQLVTEVETRINPHLNFEEHFRSENPGRCKWLKEGMFSPSIWYREKLFGYRIARIERDDLFGRYAYWLLLDHENRLVVRPACRENVLICDGYPTAEAAMDAAHDDLKMKFSDVEWRTPARRWRYETLCGGADYHEWLLVLPNYPESFYSDHFGVRNIVAHVRTNVFNDILRTSRRILFLEEVQSDWCQTGRRFGYIGKTEGGRVPYVPFAHSWHELALKAMFYIAAVMGMDGIAWTTGEQQIKRWSRYPNLDTDGLTVFYDRIIPRFMKRFCKPFGFRMESLGFSAEDQSCRVIQVEDGWTIQHASGEMEPDVFHNRKVAEDLARRKRTTTVEACPLLIMTEAMKAHIKRHGVPLFGCI